jgi:hypothetical protein
MDRAEHLVKLAREYFGFEDVSIFFASQMAVNCDETKLQNLEAFLIKMIAAKKNL